MSWSSVKTSSLVIVADAAIVYNIQQTLHTSRVGALARLLVTCAVVQWAAGLFNIDARIASNKLTAAESMENHWRNTIFNVAVNDSDNQRSKRQPTILMQCPRGHGGCQIGYSLPSQRPYWECTQCTFSEWLVKMDHQASASRRGSSNKPGRMRSAGKFVSEAAAFDAVATQLAGDGAPPPQLNCTASWDYTTALATMAGLGAPPSPMPMTAVIVYSVAATTVWQTGRGPWISKPSFVVSYRLGKARVLTHHNNNTNSGAADPNPEYP